MVASSGGGEEEDPATLEVTWTAPALADLEAIALYLLPLNPPAAARLVEDIRRAGQSLAILPNRGRRSSVPGARQIVVRGRYILVYRVRDDVRSVEIIRIVDGRTVT